MTRRTTGVVFIFIAAFLYGIHFISAAIFGSGVTSWDANLFRDMLQYTDQGLTTFSIAALVLGVIYLVWAEISDRRSA